MKKGFTLIEVLISASIFSAVFLIGTMAYIEAAKVSSSSSFSSSFESESQKLINRLDKIFENQLIDYNEYFVQCQKSKNCPIIGFEIDNDSLVNFGKNEGLYDHQFYDLGVNLDGTNDGYGTKCTNDDCNLGVIPSTEDKFMGKFGFNENTNAFCNFDLSKSLKEKSLINFETFESLSDCLNLDLRINHLFLKNKYNQNKSIITEKNGNLKMLELKNQQNVFTPDSLPTNFSEFTEDYNYNSFDTDGKILNSKNLRISNFEISISPLENPKLAVAERNNWDQLKSPKLEVSFLIEPSSNFFYKFSITDIKYELHKVYHLK